MDENIAAKLGLPELEKGWVWLVGAGLELAYLHLLTSNARFRKWVDAKLAGAAQDGNREWITLLACIYADGSYLSPALIY